MKVKEFSHILLDMVNNFWLRQLSKSILPSFLMNCFLFDWVESNTPRIKQFKDETIFTFLILCKENNGSKFLSDFEKHVFDHWSLNGISQERSEPQASNLIYGLFVC